MAQGADRPMSEQCNAQKACWQLPEMLSARRSH